MDYPVLGDGRRVTSTGERLRQGGCLCGQVRFACVPGGAQVMLGALDEAPCGLRPDVEGWTIRRELWLAPVPGARQYDRDPARD